MSLGSRIKKIRQEKQLTQAEFGKLLNLSESTISLYESGKRQPEYDTLIKIAELFDVSIDYLLGRTDVSTNPKLTRRDEREIEKILEETRKKLENAEGLMFFGEPASPEAIQSILDSMRIGMEIAKQRNKEKYTPKKYKKNKDKDHT